MSRSYGCVDRYLVFRAAGELLPCSLDVDASCWQVLSSRVSQEVFVLAEGADGRGKAGAIGWVGRGHQDEQEPGHHRCIVSIPSRKTRTLLRKGKYLREPTA